MVGLGAEDFFEDEVVFQRQEWAGHIFLWFDYTMPNAERGRVFNRSKNARAIGQ